MTRKSSLQRLKERAENIAQQDFFQKARMNAEDYMFYTYQTYNQNRQTPPSPVEITAIDPQIVDGSVGELIDQLTSFTNPSPMSKGELSRISAKDLQKNFNGFEEESIKELKGQNLLELLQMGTSIQKAAEQSANKELKKALENKIITVKSKGGLRAELTPQFQYQNYKGQKITKRTSLTDVELEIQKQDGEVERLNVSIKWFGKGGSAAARSLGIINPIQVLQSYPEDGSVLKGFTNCIVLNQREDMNKEQAAYDAYFASKLIKDVTFGNLFGTEDQKIGLFLTQTGFLKASEYARQLNSQKDKLNWSPFSGLNALSTKLGDYKTTPLQSTPIDPDRINRSNTTWARFLGSDGWRLYIQT